MSESPPPFERVGIVGFGLMGGSLGLAIKRAWPSTLVVAVDRKEVIEPAMRMQAADVGGEDLGLTGGTELIVLAAPVLANNLILASLADVIEAEALVTDLGSTKRSTVAAARALPSRLSFVGGHPLAGAAAGGVESARAEIFERRPWILTPPPDAHPVALDRLQRFIAGLGAVPYMMTPEHHDALLASISHLPQLVASALMHVVGESGGEDGLAFSGRGLRDTTRLASSPPDIWRDIAATNSDNIAAAIDRLVAALQDIKSTLQGPYGTIDSTFDSAARWKAVLEAAFDRPVGARPGYTR